MMLIFASFLSLGALAQNRITCPNNESPTYYYSALNDVCEDVCPGTPPEAFNSVCMGNIVEWRQVPHDWEAGMKIGDGTCKSDGTTRFYQGKDWWYWGDDWQERIATGAGRQELLSTSGDQTCGSGSSVMSNGVIENVDTLEDCMKRCMFRYSTNDVVREKCQYFSYIAPEDNVDSTGVGVGECTLYTSCSWPLRDRTGYNAYRLLDIYPVGFKSFSLREFNEPPTCIHVPNSRDKKVEVMIETSSRDSRVCIMDGRDMGIGTNAEVGNVKTCDNGQLYACFTAATRADSNTGDDDFYFYIFCDGSCEASDIDLWVRIRVSERPWSAGKEDTATDIEMWCEMEKGSQATATDDSGVVTEHEEFTWPSELLPDYPSKLPFRIVHTTDSPASKATVSSLLLALLGVTFLAL